MKKNYFDFFEIPISFFINKDELKSRFHHNMRQSHPDFYANESKDKQKELLDIASINNQAYQTLVNDDTRLEYLLNIYHLLDKGNEVMDNDFLMKMMELNEQLEEHPIETLNTIQQKKQQLDTLIIDCFHSFETLNYDERKDILLKVKDLNICRKYLLRMLEKASIFTTHS